MASQSHLPSAIKRSASAYAGQITSMARSLAPAHIRQGISTHVTEESDGVIRITTISTAPDAHAQEYGSGLQAQRGVKEKYPIVGKPWLAFMPTNGFKGNAYGAYNPTTREGVGEMNVMIKHQVMHPGIKATNGGKGYIRPTYAEFRKKIKGNSTLNNDIRRAIVSDIRRSFQQGKKDA